MPIRTISLCKLLIFYKQTCELHVAEYMYMYEPYEAVG